MFNSKQKEIEKLNAKCIELEQQLRNTNLENIQLRELRLQEVNNNIKILNVNKEQSKILYKIATITTQNTYGNVENNYKKIKELASKI